MKARMMDENSQLETMVEIKKAKIIRHFSCDRDEKDFVGESVGWCFDSINRKFIHKNIQEENILFQKTIEGAIEILGTSFFECYMLSTVYYLKEKNLKKGERE